MTTLLATILDTPAGPLTVVLDPDGVVRVSGFGPFDETVERLPADRQAEVRARFADRVERLREAGLLDALLDRVSPLDGAAARDLAARYLALGLVCPFLEDDSCSIYDERPFVCRRYLVTTPPALC